MLLSWLLILFMNQANAASGTQWPDHCLKNKTYPCVVYAHDKTFFKLEESDFYLAKNSLVEWVSKEQEIFYKGVSWNKYTAATNVQVPFGVLHISENSEVVIDFHENKLIVRVLTGKVKVTARADKESYELTEGTEIEMGPVDYARKVASVSLPRVIAMNTYLKAIHQVFPFSELNFQEHIEKVGKSIQAGLRMQVRWNKTIVETKMSDAHHEKLRRKYEAEHAERRDTLLRRLFRQKNNFEE